MNKEELQEKALQYALGTLPDIELEDIESQLVKDRELQTAVHEWQRVNEEDAFECEPVEPPFHIYSSIMSCVDASNSGEAARKSNRKLSMAHFVTWGGWAAAACFALIFVGSIDWGPQQSGPAAVLAKGSESDIILNDLGNPEQKAVFASDQDEDAFQDRLLELTGLAEAYWFSREGLPPESEAGADSQEFAGGFSIYDRKIKIGVIGIENIPASRLGTYYNVWAKASEGSDPVWAGMLKPGEAGSRLAFFDLSSNDAIQEMDDAISFFVTEESKKRPSQPEGRVVLSGI